MTTAKDLRKILADFEKSPESRGIELRLTLADLILKHLAGKGRTQRWLAKQAGMKESFVSRIVNSESNCTFDVAGRLLFTLGVRAEITEVHTAAAPLAIASTTERIALQIGDTAHGKKDSSNVQIGQTARDLDFVQQFAQSAEPDGHERLGGHDADLDTERFAARAVAL